MLGSAETPLPLGILMGGGGQEPGRPQPLCPSSIGRQWCWSCQGGGWSSWSYRQWPWPWPWKVWILSVFWDGESEKWVRSCGSLQIIKSSMSTLGNITGPCLPGLSVWIPIILLHWGPSALSPEKDIDNDLAILDRKLGEPLNRCCWDTFITFNFL